MSILIPLIEQECGHFDSQNTVECKKKGVFYFTELGYVVCFKHATEFARDHFQSTKKEFDNAGQTVKILQNYLKKHPEIGLEA